ncbi:hypothetical protein FU659_26375 [Paenibacillus sp. N3.4]|nr:hypothetical protein FU659_26375 [Paenibacillus sp. N3.4]
MMIIKKIVGIVGILTILLELSTHMGHAAASKDPFIHRGTVSKQVTVIAIPGLSFLELQPNQLAELPHVKMLTESAAVGAMNIRTTKRSMQDVYLTLSAGAPAVGNSSVQAFGASENWHDAPVSAIVRRYHGEGFHADRVEPNAIFVPQIEMLKKINAEPSNGAGVGSLGEVLKEHHVNRIVLGNSDLGKGAAEEEKRLRRSAALMLIDGEGYVDQGALGDEVLIPSVDRPYGVMTNYAQLLQLWEKIQISSQITSFGESPVTDGDISRSEPSSLTLIELGDLYRLYKDRQHYSKERYQQLKKQVLREMDSWIGQLAASMSGNQSLWMFSPEVSSTAANKKAYLSPILHYTTNGREGMLFSESTRRLGVITAQDFTSTLLHEFNIPVPPRLVGIPIASQDKEHAFASLLQDQTSMQAIYRIRPRLLYSFVTFEMMVLLGSLFFVVWMRRGEAVDRYLEMRPPLFFAWGRSIRILLLSLLAAPSTMLVMGGWVLPLTTSVGIEAAIGLLCAIFVVLTFLLAIVLDKWCLSKAMMWLGCGTAWMIALDGSTGAHMMKYSVLGYDPMIGARFYGIGNEYMGVLIGALVLGVTAALQRRHGEWQPAMSGGLEDASPRGSLAEMEMAAAIAPAARASRTAALVTCAAFLLVTACLAAPSLGANAGGALSAAVAFGVAGVRCFAGGRWRELRLSRGIALLAALLALGLGALWLLNSADSPAAAARESHVGRAFHALREGQFDQIGQMIERKLRMNVHLIRASAWSKVLLTSLFVMAVLVLRPRGRLRLWQHKYPYWMYGFSANMIGAIAALLLNDSGIVAAATMIIFVAVPMLLLRLQELET